MQITLEGVVISDITRIYVSLKAELHIEHLVFFIFFNWRSFNSNFFLSLSSANEEKTLSRGRDIVISPFSLQMVQKL